MTGRSPLSVPCPSCKAPPGQPCRHFSRGIGHGSRIAAARNTENNAERQRKLRVARDFLRP